MLPQSTPSHHAGIPQPVRRIAKWTASITGALISILALVWILLQWVILPRLQAWQPELEQWTGKALGTPVRIRQLAVDGDLWAPVVRLEGLTILGADGRPAFELPQIRATLTPGSLLPRGWRQWHPHLQRIEMDGPDLVVRRDPQGTLSIAGITLSGAGDPQQSQAAADWVFTQGEWVVRRGRIHWIDQAGSAPPPVTLEQVDLMLSYRGGRHRLQLAATPPSAWGERLQVSADMRSKWWDRLQHPGDWKEWQGTVHVDLPRADLAALLPYVPAQNHLQRGVGRVSADLDIDRLNLRRATAQVALSDLDLRWDATRPTLDVQSLSGAIEVDQRQDRDWRFSARQLTLILAGDDPQRPTWPASDLSLRLRGDPLQWSDGEARATRLDLQSLARLSSFIPLPQAVRRSIDDLRPAGSLHDMQATWVGPLEAPKQWSVRGQGQQIGWAERASDRSTPARPLPGRPGLSGGDITFQADQEGGQAIVRMRQGALAFPGVFEEPSVPMDQLDAELRWTLSRPKGAAEGAPPDVRVDVRRAAFVNPDTRGEFSGTWQTGDGRKRPRLPGVLKLDAQAEQVQASRVHRYLPLQIPAGTRHYVRDGMKEGRAHHVRAKVQGPLDDFPWPRNQGGEFRIAAQVDGLTYDFAPTTEATLRWPVLTQVRGELLFEGQGMRVRQAQAQIGRSGSGQFRVQDVQATINDYVHDDVLRIDGQGTGPLADALHFVAHSPVSAWLQHVLDPAQVAGAAGLKLSLQLPLSRIESSRVQGRVTLQNNSIALRPDVPRLEQARGQVLFDERGFKLEGTQAQGLGGAVTVSGGSQPDGTVVVRGRGTATAAGLRSAAELGWVASLAHFMAGQAEYDLDLRFEKAGMHLDIRSPLTGLALHAPAPLGKEASAALPLRVQIRPAEAAEAPRGVTAESIRVDVPKVLGVHYVREAQAPFRALRGAVQVGAQAGSGGPALPAERSVRYVIDLPSAHLDEWLAWQDRATHFGVLDDRADAPDLGYRPSDVIFRTPRLGLGTRTLTHVQAQLRRETVKDGQSWAGMAQADQLAGQVLALLPSDNRHPLQIKARLTRLNLSSDDAPTPASAAHIASGTSDTRPSSNHDGVSKTSDARLPSLDLEADRFELDGKPLGRLLLKAGHQTGLNGPGTWTLQNLTLTQPDAQLQAVGRWQSPVGGNASQTRLSFRLQVGDAGALLARMGQAGALRGGRGQLSGQIGWQGSPTQFNVASLDGQLQLDLGRGQFLRAEPGVARLLGVLSLQSLPRRLLFDFRDVFQEGFSFDRIDGQVKVNKGVASTQNLRIRGVQAMVLTEGQADLDQETQDLKVWVVPDINAGAASLAYAVINPAVGLGTLLGQMFLSKPLTEAATREFHITGRWEAPQVTAVKQRTPVPQGGEDPPTAGSAASSALHPDDADTPARPRSDATQNTEPGPATLTAAPHRP